VNSVPELESWHKQSRISYLETDFLFELCSTVGVRTRPFDPVWMCAQSGRCEENTLISQIAAVILHLDRGHIWLWVVWKRWVFSSDFDLIQAIANISVRNAIKLLVKLNQAYLFYVKIGLVKVNRSPQQLLAAAFSKSVATL
jgi:hypothetical protein